MFTLMSGRKKKGNWHPGDPQMAITMMGGTCLDLTQVETNKVSLILFTLMGGTEVIVPHGATVDLDGFMLMGGSADKVERFDGGSNMHVRIQSWGAMGGCDVRTPKFKPHELQLAAKRHRNQSPSEHDITFRGGLVLLYRFFAMLVTFAIPVPFLLGAFDIIDRDTSNLCGIMTGLTAGLIWSGSGYFRILIGAGPESTDDSSLAEYYFATKLGTLIRSVALVFAFACPALFILRAFEVPYIGEQISGNGIQLTAILCAIFAGALFALSGFVEEFIYGKRS